MKYLKRTHGTGFELVRHFFARMFDSELSRATGQWQTVAVGVITLLLPGGLLLIDPQYIAKYRGLSRLPSPEPFRATAMADHLALLTLVFAITGLVAMLQWQSLFPSRRDYLALAALPIRPGQVFAARFAAVLAFSTVVVAAMNTLPSLVAPFVITGRWQKNPSVLVNMAANVLSSGLACYFALFAVIAIQGILLNVFSGRLFARVSVHMQGTLMALLFLAALFSFSIAEWSQATLAELPRFGRWAPPVWFLGLHEAVLGDRDPFLNEMAARGLAAVSAAAVGSVLFYLISYRRYRRLLLESPVEVAVPRVRCWSALALLGRRPRQEAILQFMAKTLARSRMHRTALLAYAGVAAGIMLNMVLAEAAATRFAHWRSGLQLVAVASPLAVSFIVLAGLRHVFSMPTELSANWLFQLTESQGRAEWMTAVERFVPVCAILPVYLLCLPLGVTVLGWQMALQISVLQLLVTFAVFEVMFQSWQKLPFTCGYVPGKRPLLSVLIGYLVVLGVCVPLVSLIVAGASRSRTAFLIFLVIFGAVWVRARKLRRDGWGEAVLVYEDPVEIVPDLGLRS